MTHDAPLVDMIYLVMFELLVGVEIEGVGKMAGGAVLRRVKSYRRRPFKMITIPYLTALTTYFSYGLLFAFGQLRDFFRKTVDWCSHNSLQGYAPICLGLEDFYIRRLYLRIQDCFNRPISSSPDAWFDVVERISNDNNKTLKRTTRINRCLNLGSYNYLGFAAADEYCTPRVIESLKSFSPSTCSTRVDGGTTTLHAELEECVASFVGKPAALVFGMGYVTNSAILPVLIGKGGLIISDSLNHNSIVNGARGSGSTIRVFQHNTPSHLEKVLREQIAEGQPRTHRPWKKIIVLVEGIYSMEGELCQLPEIVSICKKFKAYVYLDEAHSIGAIGKSGRGVCELLGIDTSDVDVMMGTFTKSFGSCGGYIAGSNVVDLSSYHQLVLAWNLPIVYASCVGPHKTTTPNLTCTNILSKNFQELIQYLKYTCPAHLYATSISPPAAQQIISSIKVLLGEDGSSRGAQKLAKIRENSNFFRSELQKMGFEVLGDNDSPVMPIMLYNPAKIPAFSRECLKRNVAVVTVAFPATPLLLARARICISAAHSREDLIKALEVISRVGDMVGIKYFPAEPKKHEAERGVAAGVKLD
ncbi:long chain base biosynthesis protein 2a [Phtheirospermum japonicum]|uniref:serine C-palmitoyltransferase n=1 Tax=Phtheirospermum japonicum TaxID=374723 RepID=A0A830BVN2_9LAMI|nr:long chain base biosynthesis protein 2a [Phtheirospermum japonicum]